MDLKSMIELADVKEMQAYAYLRQLNGNVPNEVLQRKVDAYCENMAISFIEKHSHELNEMGLLVDLRRYISGIHADKPHSGYRFYEALYKKLSEIEPYKEKQ